MVLAPDLEAQLLGTVNAIREEMNRRLGTLSSDVKALDNKLDGVCDQVGALDTARKIDKALAEQAVAAAASHTLAYRWRVGIAIAAGSGVLGLIVALLNFVASR